MNKQLQKSAEILVECGHIVNYHKTDNKFIHLIGMTVDPFADTLEGRRQFDVIKGYLLWHHKDLWEKSWGVDAKYYMSVIDSIYQKIHEWDIKRAKWCIESLIGGEK